VSIFIVLTSCKDDTSTLKLEVLSFPNEGIIPDKYALCVPEEGGKFEFGENTNPHIRWSGIPPKTKSLALFFIDLDRPENLRHVNVRTKTITEDEPRTEFYHWVLIDIPVNINEIPEAAVSTGVIKGGKQIGRTAYGVRGLNDFTRWFRGDMIMGGQYAGYDGPCPPWNDEKIHRYVFRLFALDVAQLGLGGRFSAEDAQKAMKEHILAKSEWTGKYTTNADLRKSYTAKSGLESR